MWYSPIFYISFFLLHFLLTYYCSLEKFRGGKEASHNGKAQNNKERRCFAGQKYVSSESHRIQTKNCTAASAKK